MAIMAYIVDASFVLYIDSAEVITTPSTGCSVMQPVVCDKSVLIYQLEFDDQGVNKQFSFCDVTFLHDYCGDQSTFYAFKNSNEENKKQME